MANDKPRKFGLIGKNISYSFSATYFTEKFEQENLQNCSYQNFDLSEINSLKEIIADTAFLRGLNVTIPYKKEVLPFLDEINKKALEIGAVNTIKISKNKKLKGYNTDYYGFKKAIQPFLKPHHKKALILGTGGASNAVAFALQQMGISFKFVSRNPTSDQLGYENLDHEIFDEYHLIINCTPLGTYPNTDEFPPLPYSFFTSKHLAFDLIYNPAETTFLKKAKAFGAETSNGYQMLVFQAEKAWSIWNK